MGVAGSLYILLHCRVFLWRWWPILPGLYWTAERPQAWEPLQSPACDNALSVFNLSFAYPTVISTFSQALHRDMLRAPLTLESAAAFCTPVDAADGLVCCSVARAPEVDCRQREGGRPSCAPQHLQAQLCWRRCLLDPHRHILERPAWETIHVSQSQAKGLGSRVHGIV